MMDVQYDFPFVRVSGINDARQCPECAKIAGRIFLHDDAPELPYHKCSNKEDGCRCCSVSLSEHSPDVQDFIDISESKPETSGKSIPVVQEHWFKKHKKNIAGSIVGAMVGFVILGVLIGNDLMKEDAEKYGFASVTEYNKARDAGAKTPEQLMQASAKLREASLFKAEDLKRGYAGTPLPQWNEMSWTLTSQIADIVAAGHRADGIKGPLEGSDINACMKMKGGWQGSEGLSIRDGLITCTQYAREEALRRKSN